MFQNISGDFNQVNDDYDIKKNKVYFVLKELFTPHNCVIYILTFLVSMVEIKHEILPFGLAILAACLGSTVPIFMVYIVSFVSTLIFHGGSGLASYFYTSLIFFLLIFMFKPKVSIDERNEIFNVGGRIFLASFIYNLIKNFRDVFLIYDLFLGLIIAALTYTFYKIFVNGIVVIRDFKEKKVFTVEELIAGAIICSIAVSVLNKVTIFSLSISNILIIFIILFIGWQNGMLVGGTAGLSIGLALTLVGNITILQLTVFAVSGILAGIFNKFGKIGVVLGFVLGNAILTYLATGNTATIIYFREIFISAIGLLFVPSRVKINIEDIIGKEKLLTNRGEHRFNYYEEIKEKLNVVVDTISNIKNNYIGNEKNSELRKEVFVDEFIELMEEYMDNIFYEEVINNVDLLYDIYNSFKVDDILTENGMIKIFRKYNNYILLRDQKIKDDLQELIKVANRVYRQLQMKKIKEETRKEESLKIKNELKNVSNIIEKASNDVKSDTKFQLKEKELTILLNSKNYIVNGINIRQCSNNKIIVNINFEYKEELRDKSRIANISDIISRCLSERFSFQKDKKNLSTGLYMQTYSAEDKYGMQVGCARITKEGSKISGDSNLQIRLEDGKYLLAISDGMGSGQNAKESSKYVINSLNNLLEKGFEENDALNLINSGLNLNKNSEMYASIDMSVFDLYKGELVIIKNGACNTYIKNKKNVLVYSSKEMPIGIVEDINLSRENLALDEGDIILMCSDGLLDSKEEMSEDWVKVFLKNVNTNNVQKIADLIVSEAIDNSYGMPKDDITVIVAKIIKRK